MAKTVECMKCKKEDAGIPKKLQCSQCGTEYVYDSEHKLYFLKYSKCEKCRQMSGTISSNRVCEYCGARYVFDKETWLDDGELRWADSKGFKFSKFQSENTLLFIELVLLALVLIPGIIYFLTTYVRIGLSLPFFLGLLAFSALVAFDAHRRLTRLGFDFASVTKIFRRNEERR